MVLAIAYASTVAGDPHRLSAQAIGRIASDIRTRLFGVQPRPVDVAALIAKTARLVVNGKPITLSWGLDRSIHDEDGREALGVCENDPELPDTVMISINTSLLAHQPEVIRSTAAHEFAHAIFDMPAIVQAGSAQIAESGNVQLDRADLGGDGMIRRAFRTLAAPATPMPGAPLDWVEWRADEFMGAFLVPAYRLAHVLPKHASALDLSFRWRETPDGHSFPFIDLDPSEGRLSVLIDHLAETFGVTAAFMSVRLAKGGFIGRRLETRRTP